MASVQAVVFPFRRLVVWLSVLVLGVGALALVASALFVLPPLKRNLERDRVDQIERTALQSQGTFVANFARALRRGVEQSPDEAVEAYGVVTDTRPYVFTALGPTAVAPFTDPAGDARDPVALASLAAGRLEAGLVSRPDSRHAEAAYPFRVGDQIYVVLITSSLSDVADTVELVRRRILIAAAVGLPVAWVVGALGAMLLVMRIRRLERASRRIAAGDFAEPVRDDGRDEIGQLAASFDDMRLRLERTDRARREFIANASHELRTPLFAIGASLELIEDEDPDEEGRRDLLHTMRTQVDRMTRLATDLLDLSRLDAGGVRFHQEPVDLGTVAAAVARELGPLAGRRGSEVAVRPGAARAEADPVRVGQIVRALVDNALRHNPPGTRVVVRPWSDAERSGLDVRDDGPPVPAEHVDRLFDRFFRGGGGEGSGLGLAIAAELAGRMGGGLDLVQDGDGKAFRLALPTAGPAEAAAPARPVTPVPGD